MHTFHLVNWNNFTETIYPGVLGREQIVERTCVWKNKERPVNHKTADQRGESDANTNLK